MSDTTIYRDGAGYAYACRDAGPGLEHCWLGTPVKQVKGTWVPKKGQPERLVRRAGTTRVAP